jgi:hypothetical protein
MNGVEGTVGFNDGMDVIGDRFWGNTWQVCCEPHHRERGKYHHRQHRQADCPSHRFTSLFGIEPASRLSA